MLTVIVATESKLRVSGWHTLRSERECVLPVSPPMPGRPWPRHYNLILELSRLKLCISLGVDYASCLQTPMHDSAWTANATPRHPSFEDTRSDDRYRDGNTPYTPADTPGALASTPGLDAGTFSTFGVSGHLTLFFRDSLAARYG